MKSNEDALLNAINTLCIWSIFAYILAKCCANYCFLLKKQNSKKVKAFKDGFICWFTLHINW